MNYKWNIYGLYVFSFFTYFYLWMPIWVIFLQKKGMSLTSIGILDAFAFLLIALLEIPSGALADWLGRKYTLVIGALSYAIGMFFLAITDTVSILIIGYMLWHMSNSFFSGTNMALLYDTLKKLNIENEYQKIAGRLRAIISTALASGSVLGSLVAGYSINNVFYLVAILSFISAFVAFSFKEPNNNDENSQSKNSIIMVLKNSFDFIKSKPTVRNLIILIATISTIPFIVIYVLIQPYAQENNIPIEYIGFIMVMVQGFGIIGSLMSNKIKTIIDKQKQIIIAPLIMVVMLFLISAFHYSVGLIFFGLLSFVLSVFNLTLNTKLNELIKSSERATILSCTSMINALLIVIYEPLVLFLNDKFNISISLLFSAIFMLLTTVPLALMLFRKITFSDAKLLSVSENTN